VVRQAHRPPLRPVRDPPFPRRQRGAGVQTMDRVHDDGNARDTRGDPSEHPALRVMRMHDGRALAAEQIAATTSGIPQSRYAEMIYWHAVALVNMNRVDESLPFFAHAFRLEPGWRELTPRLPHSGLLPDNPQLIQRILESEKTHGQT